VDIDPTTGIAYLTEDDFRGDIPADPTAEVVADDAPPGSRVSFLYRYIPRVSARKPGNLQKGGKLQVLTLDELNYNADLANPGQKFGVVWKDVNAEDRTRAPRTWAPRGLAAWRARTSPAARSGSTTL
jgi:uncharacterized protein